MPVAITKKQTKLVMIKNKCLLPPWVLMIMRETIGSLIPAQRNTWRSNENGSPLTNPSLHERCTWEMTPFWRPLAKGASRPQCKLEVKCCLQPSHKFFMFRKWRIVSFLLANSFRRAWKWNLTRMVVRSTMSMEPLWRKHEGRRTCIFSTSMFERRVQMWQSLRMKELCFGTKDSATSTWRVLRSWRIWSIAWIWMKCHCTMCEACIEGKHQRTSFPKGEASRASKHNMVPWNLKPWMHITPPKVQRCEL